MRLPSLLLVSTTTHALFVAAPRRSTHLRSSADDGGQSLEGLESEYWNSLSSTEKTILAKSRAGGEYLKLGQLEDALACYDVAQDLSGNDRYEWHRGLALFYLGREGDAAADLLANAARFEARFDEPATEERIFAAAAAMRSAPAAPPRVAESPLRESRPVLRAARDLFFAGGGDAPTMAWKLDELKAACRSRGLKVSGRKAELVARLADAPAADAGGGDTVAKAFDSLRTLCAAATAGDPLRRRLFGHFYAGLYHEAGGDETRAAAHIALAHRRAGEEAADDLTVKLPQIHADARGWVLGDVPPADLARAETFQ